MSEQRWRVEKRDRWIAGEFWTAFQGEKGWFDPTPMFDTWEEAIQEADRMARTITVTLPANPDRVMPVTTIRTISYPEGTWTESTYKAPGGQDVTIPDAYRESLALALLAHARKEQHRG